MNNGAWIIGVALGLLVHMGLIIGTVGLAAEKNRKPLLWLPVAMVFSPITFILICFLDYIPRNRQSHQP